MDGKKPIKILVFSVSIGAGHDSVAQAIAERLLSEVPGSEVKIVDTFRYINSVLNKVVVGSYMETLRFTPKVWGYLYDQAEEGDKLVELSQVLAKILSPKLVQLINEVNPQIIMTTHAFPTGMLGAMKCRGQIETLLASAVTDFHIHPIWISKGIDLYFIHSPDLAYPLIQEGISRERIRPVGIPIRMQFGQKTDSLSAKKELCLSGDPVVLVMGGGLGLGRIEVITKKILSDERFGVVVVAGKNKRLYNNLTKWNNPRLRVFGYVENMARVIAACDLVISKPGGVTTAEVLAVGKPLVIYSSLPGQEDRNTNYLLNRGAAIKVKNLDTLIPEILSLWQNPLRLQQMEETAKQLGSPHSSKLVWDNLWSYLEREISKVGDGS
ncbi:MAG: glycosyltransferase [Clostridia bacterium]|jgi:processive 1,2-diacylglycerol beta-glucosyltransferase|nr:glycosyltransferase [Clostridia bacterium]MDD4146365.1 glycosyltransferase [Clostridia bacterium]MDD4665655.1 glycosyltransferase [Clostridia bacterium]